MTRRVVHVINSLGAGGAERSLAELLPHLRDHRILPMLVLLTRTREGLEEQVRGLGVDVYRLRATSWPGRIHELRSLLRRTDPDLIHTTLFEADVVGRLAALGRLPVLTSLVNTSYDPVRLQDPRVARAKLRGTQIIDAATARLLNDHFHAVSHAVKDASVRTLRLDPADVTVVPRGRDPARLGDPGAGRREQVRRALGVASDQRVLLNVGRREYQKGQRYLIEAAAMMRERFPDAVWLVAGRDGNESADLAWRRAATGLEQQVRFLGHVDDVPELLAAADVFVFPSLYEGLGGAVIEAMALGVPVVASDLPSIREVTGDGAAAALVRPGDPGALAGAIEELLTDPVRAQTLGTAGRRRFQRHYTLSQMVDGMAALFHRVADVESS